MELVLAEYGGAEKETGTRAGVAREGALDFAADWADKMGPVDDEISPAVAFERLARIGNRPTLAEVQELKSWVMEDNNGLIFKAVESRGLPYYLIHPRAFVDDLHGASKWPTGFLKQTFKLPLPYDMLLSHIWSL